MFLAFIFSFLAFVNSFIPQPTLTEGVVGQPKSLNVLDLASNQPDHDIAKFVHRGLLKYDNGGNIIPDLAESYKVSDDKKVYTFTLHKGLHWHDGRKFSSDDVIYTVSKLNLQSVEVDKLDEYTIRFRLVRDPYSPFLDLMTQYLLPSNYGREEKSGIYQVGIGDFRIARVVKSDKVDSVILTPAWTWNSKHYKFSRIIFNFYKNNSDLVTAARLGENDAFGSSATVPDLPNFQKITAPIASRYYALYFNLKNDALKDKTFRQYLASLTPKQALVQQVLGGGAVVSNSPLEYTFVVPDATASAVKKFDVKFKKEWTTSLTLTIPQALDSNVSGADDLYLKIGQFIKQAWEKGGIKVNLVQIPLDKMFTEVIAKKDFDVLLFGQEVSRDPDIYTLWHSAQKDLPGLDFTSYASVLVDRSLEDGRKEFNKEERSKFYQNFLKIFNEDVPAIMLYHPLYTYSFRKDLIGPSLNGFFFTSNRFLNFDQWKKK